MANDSNPAQKDAATTSEVRIGRYRARTTSSTTKTAITLRVASEVSKE